MPTLGNLKERQKDSMVHSDKLGSGAAKRRKLLHGKEKVDVVMSEFKRGTLHSGSGAIVKKRKQAIAIAMSESGQSKTIGNMGGR